MPEKEPVYRRLNCLQEVKNNQALYYLQSKNPYEIKKIAWITSGAPVEFLYAMDILPLYPEQYGAIAGAAKDSTRLCQVAEKHGFSADLCAYARTSFGSIFSTLPPTPLHEIDGTGGLAKPDFLVAGNNICGTVLKWYQELSRIFNVPLFLFDTPPLNSDEIPSHYLEYIMVQLDEYMKFIENQVNKKFDEEKLTEVMQNSKRGIELWSEILVQGKKKPSPLNCADRFLLMAPIVSQRGTFEIIALYENALEEIKDRINQNLGAITVEERYRLLFDNIPIWFNLYDFFNTLAEKGVVFPVDTYTHAWSMEFQETGELLKDVAIMYSNIYLNKTLQHKIDLISSLAKDYSCDGILYHSMRSCKRYSLGQPVTKREVTELTGIPGTLIEGDMCDARSFSEEQAMTRIEALLEIISK